MITSIKQVFDDFVSKVGCSVGLDIIQTKFLNQQCLLIDIIVERHDREKMSVNDCHALNLALKTHEGQLLDMLGVHRINISSAGLERPLVKLEDYDRFKGSTIKIKMIDKIDRAYILEGQLIARAGNIVRLRHHREEIDVEYSNIKSGKLVLTDELFRTLLTKEGSVSE